MSLGMHYEDLVLSPSLLSVYENVTNQLPDPTTKLFLSVAMSSQPRWTVPLEP